MSHRVEPALSLEERERRGRSDLPLELVLVRHAEPDWQSARQKGADPGLTALGRRQAAALAEHLRHHPLAALYCSPLERARETAAAIAATQQLAAIVVSDLAEIGVPMLSNVSQTEVDAYFLAAAKRPLREHWEGFPGGEPFREFHTRVTRAIAGVFAHYGVHAQVVDGFPAWSAPARAQTLRIGVVAHGGTNSVILTHLLGIAPVPWEWIRFETPLAAYSVVALRAINDQGYVWSLQQFGRRALPPLAAESVDKREGVPLDTPPKEG
ncbi:MAG TPA: histidine phosphatase family protein, partial [Candidatus Acidoferrales bacterium]|nr:histidine phosphatase family protein [Candidatus Acidoferrales bacterium]